MEQAAHSLGKELSCAVCMSVFRDAVMTKCDHYFCRECIHSALGASPKCPLCNAPVKRRELRVDELMRGLVEGYKRVLVACGIASPYCSQLPIRAKPGRDRPPPKPPKPPDHAALERAAGRIAMPPHPPRLPPAKRARVNLELGGASVGTLMKTCAARSRKAPGPPTPPHVSSWTDPVGEWVVCPSGLNKRDTRALRQLADRAGSAFELAETFDASLCTHVVVTARDSDAGEGAAMTSEHLLGLASGAWVVHPGWVWACLALGAPAPEDAHEATPGARARVRGETMPLRGYYLYLAGPPPDNGRGTKDRGWAFEREMIRLMGGKVLSALPGVRRDAPDPVPAGARWQSESPEGEKVMREPSSSAVTVLAAFEPGARASEEMVRVASGGNAGAPVSFRWVRECAKRWLAVSMEAYASVR